MKKLLGYLLLLALAAALPLYAQTLGPPGGGGSTFPPTGCVTANGVIFNNATPCDAGFTKAAGATGAVTVGGTLNLPDTAAGPIGIINFAGTPFLHDAGSFDSVFLGHSAGNLTLTGVRNVVVGESAGVGLTSGGNNIFIGRFAGGQVQSTGNNVGIGSATLAGGTGIANATAVGFGALGSSTGNNNTAVGSTAGSTILGGTGNVIVGQGSTPGITTGTNNTILGAGVTGLSTTLASAVVIAANGTKADFGVTTAGTWSFNGAVAATLASAAGTNAVCNTPGTQTALTVQVWATGCAVSSARFKDAITVIDREKAFETVLGLAPVSYFYKPEFNMGADKHIGFTAEQVATVNPFLVTFEDDGVTPHAVKYNEMAPLFVAAIQQLKTENDDLRARLEALEARR